MSAWTQEQLHAAELALEFDRGYALHLYEQQRQAWYELLDLNYQNSLLNEPENIFFVEGELIEGGLS